MKPEQSVESADQNEAAVKLQPALASLASVGTAAVSYCNVTDGHCITCSDEAVSVQVVRLDAVLGLATVIRVGEPEFEEEIDVTLLETVTPGDMVLAHGGVALARIGGADDE